MKKIRLHKSQFYLKNYITTRIHLNFSNSELEKNWELVWMIYVSNQYWKRQIQDTFDLSKCIDMYPAASMKLNLSANIIELKYRGKLYRINDCQVQVHYELEKNCTTYMSLKVYTLGLSNFFLISLSLGSARGGRARFCPLRVLPRLKTSTQSSSSIVCSSWAARPPFIVYSSLLRFTSIIFAG